MTQLPEPKALTRIVIAGYRSLKNVTLEPGRVTVLIGANGAGKSNVLSVLRMIPLMRTQSLRRFVAEAGGASALLHYGPQHTPEIEVRLEFRQDSGEIAWSARLGYAADDTLLYVDEQVAFRAPGQADFKARSLGAGHTESRLEEEALKQGASMAKTARWWLANLNFFHFHDTSRTAALRANARQIDDRFLRSDGSNLAAFLLRLSVSETADAQAAWQRITGLLRQVAPYVKQLQPEFVAPDSPETSAVRLAWIDERDHRFDAHDLSDGTLRALALITALAQPAATLPAFISIDEPELGLHPAALAMLCGLVKSVSSRTQVLLATQSPALLDEFEPADVVVCDRTQGETNLRRLDVAGLAQWREEYSLSEIYDKNLIGGRP